MNRSPFAATALGALLLAALPAQGFVVVARFGASDLVLNKPLIEAIVGAPEVEAEVRRVAGEALKSWTGTGVDLPAPHLAGTFQIHLWPNLSWHGDPTQAQNDAIADAIVTHLKQKLDGLLYRQPLEQLTARREELGKRHAELQHRRVQFLLRSEGAAANAALVARQRETIDQQLLQARLDTVTEDRGLAHLERMRTEYAARRDELRAQHAKRDAECGELELVLAGLTERCAALAGGRSDDDLPATIATQLQQLRERLSDAQRALQQARRAAGELDEGLQDAQRLLSVALEQLPNGALAAQRARARLQSLTDEGKALAVRAAKADAERLEAAHLEAEAEQLLVDLTVCKTLLAEVQGKLARLEPVRYEVLRQR